MVYHRVTRSGFLLLSLLLLFQHLAAQPFLLPAHKKREIIPFKFIKNLIIIPVSINGKGPFNFVLDSGVGLVLITDYKLADSLKLQNLRNIKLAGLGEKGDLDAAIAPYLNLEVGKASAQSIPVAMLKEDAFNLSEFAGMPIHGLLGYEFFSSFIIRISYSNKVLILYPPHTAYIPRKGNKIPISIEEHKPYVQTELKLNNGEIFKAKLIMDTGAGHPISLEDKWGAPFPIPDINIAENLGVGLAGAIKGYLGRMPALTIGKYQLNEVIAAFPDYNEVGAKSILTGRNGNLGNAVLKHFDPVLDYSRNVMYLKPSIYFKEKFDYDMSGLEFSSIGPEYNRLIINRVAPDSPGELYDIKPGDEILSINLKPVSEMSVNEIYELFKSGDERGFLLDILPKNSDKRRKVIFTPKRRI